MNDQLKQRLVGAIVLVALAVIFLPMIFKGDGSALDSKDVPPEPDYRFPPPKEAPKPPPMAAAPIVPVDEAGKSTATKKVEVETKKEQTAESRVPEKLSTKTSAITSGQEKESKPVQSGQVDAWVVQVGSFSSEPNAVALRDKLRKMGFASFVEAVKGDKGMVYRVRVGPELTQELADKLKTQLAKKAKLKGLVQSYP